MALAFGAWPSRVVLCRRDDCLREGGFGSGHRLLVSGQTNCLPPNQVDIHLIERWAVRYWLRMTDGRDMLRPDGPLAYEFIHGYHLSLSADVTRPHFYQ